EWAVPAALALAAGMAVALVGIFRALKRQQPGKQRQIGLGCLAGALAIALHDTVDFLLRIPAILALFCVLLGVAADAGGAVMLSRERRRRVAASMELEWLGLGAFGLRPIPATAEAHYAEGRRLLAAGRAGEAAAAYCRALAANSYAAPFWWELAWIAESQGDAQCALALAGLARDLEPHRLRGDRASANLYRRQGEMRKAAESFSDLLSYAPSYTATPYRNPSHTYARKRRMVRNPTRSYRRTAPALLDVTVRLTASQPRLQNARTERHSSSDPIPRPRRSGETQICVMCPTFGCTMLVKAIPHSSRVMASRAITAAPS